MNNCTFIGNLTADVTTKEFDGGGMYANFSIAVERPYTSRDGQKKVDFIKVTARDKVAANCAKYLSKGSRVGIIGSLETSSYEKNGVKMPDFKIMATSVDFLSAKADNHNDAAPASEKRSKDTLVPTDVSDDDMPF